MTISIEVSSPISVEEARCVTAMMAVITGTSVPVPGTGGGSTGPGTLPAADPNFPVGAHNAPFPSPEDSEQGFEGDVVVGKPYLRDANGAVYSLAVQDGKHGVTVNGVAFWPGALTPPARLLVRNKTVYANLESGQWQSRGDNGSWYNHFLPPADVPGGGTGLPPPVPVITMPVPSTIEPGTSGRTVNCGSSRELKSLAAGIAAAQAGDTVLLDPGASDVIMPKAWGVPLLIDLGGASFDCTGHTAELARGKAFLVPCADSIIQNGSITGVAMDQTQGQNTSGIRPDEGCGYLTLRNMKINGNQCGVGHGGFPFVLAIENSDISGNGLKENSGSKTHNLYVGSECARMTLTNVVSTNPTEAHAIKFRGHKLIVNGGTFEASNGSCFDLSNGGEAIINNAVMNKPADAGDHKIIGYALEGAENGLAGITINGGAIHADCDHPLIQIAGGTITVSPTTVKTGNPITFAGGGTVTGL